MLNKDFLRRKISLIEDDLTRLTEFEKLTLGDIASDYRTQAIVERLLERVIGRALDINQHLIAEKGAHLKSVTKYRETFLRLAELDVYPCEFAEKIAPSAGFRNALVHDYNDIDPRILQKSIGETIREFNEYGKYVLEYVEREESGFGLIGLIIAVAVIAALTGGGLYFREGQQRKSQIQMGLEAEKKAKELRDRIMNQQRQQLEAAGENPATPQPSPSNSALSGVEGWKTYRNEKYGFEVKYPLEWNVEVRNLNPPGTLEEMHFGSKERGFLTISIFEGGVSKLAKIRERWERDFAKTRDYVVDGKPGFWHEGYEVSSAGVFFLDGYIFRIGTEVVLSNIAEDEMRVFISTFKFIK